MSWIACCPGKCVNSEIALTRRRGDRFIRPLPTVACAAANIRPMTAPDYKSALNVWMAAAEAGDAEAQTNVGEIFERGLGGEPNYEAALIWYRKSADQGNARAQFALGTLYEQGLGVERDQREALNWYRLAWGLTEDNLIFESAANREQEALRAELAKSLEEKDAQLELLKRQLKDMEAKLAASLSANKAASSDAQHEATTLKSLIVQIEAQRAKDKQQMDALPKTREPTRARGDAKSRRSRCRTREGLEIRPVLRAADRQSGLRAAWRVWTRH